MKAIVYRSFGSADVLRYEEIAKPTPGKGQVLIRVRAASVNPLDWKMMAGGPYIVRKLMGLGKPAMRTPGVDVAGEVEAVGSGEAEFKVGDQVFGTCPGAFAEYALSPASIPMLRSALAIKPENVSFEQAASAPVAGLTALQGLRDKEHVRPGQQVLINGAAGGVGTFVVQIAKGYGGVVTGVCSTRNVELVQSLGADRVIDYSEEDFSRSSRSYDLIFDAVGNHSLSDYRRVLKPHGTLVMVGAPKSGPMLEFMGRVAAAAVRSSIGPQKMGFFIAKSTREDLTMLGALIASGKVRPVIDRRYPLSETADALRYSEEGHVRGKVVIVVE